MLVEGEKNLRPRQEKPFFVIPPKKETALTRALVGEESIGRNKEISVVLFFSLLRASSNNETSRTRSRKKCSGMLASDKTQNKHGESLEKYVDVSKREKFLFFSRGEKKCL